MRRRRTIGLAALGVSAGLALAACTTSSSSTAAGGGSPTSSAGATGFNAAVSSVVNPSTTKTSGTINFGNSSAPDSTDPANTYYAYMWNFVRLYTMPLMTYKSCPGPCGLQVVPSLATAPGQVSDNGLTWTYHIQPNVKFEDGSTVTSKDVKYAVERTFDRGLFPLGPNYFSFLLAGNAAKYPGPYKDKSSPDKMGLTAVDTPNDTTIVFHLAKPFADFDYVAAIPQTSPVPPAKDTGANYQLHPISTGPYMFSSYQLNKQLTLVPNPAWQASTDPNAKQLVSKITMTMNMNAADIDNRLLAGDLQVDSAGTGVQAAARARILASSSLKASSDDPVSGFTWYTTINTTLAPLNNVHCRIAIQYAASKTDYQDAYGGQFGGQIASTVSPPNVVGHKNFDLYGATTDPGGNTAKAKQELQACGQPNGFSTGIAYRSDRPKEVAVAQALQASLGQVGIRLTLHGFPTATYSGNFAGVPKYVAQHDIGLSTYGWAPDWPDGYGFFYYIAAGSAISPAGNTNQAQLNDPVVNDMLAKMATTNDAATRNSLTGQIDLQIMKDAAILPGVWAKSLLYRNPSLTNVYVQTYYGMYNYAVLGVKQ
jgi:peptide/nickel transport system substrate-binding protein